MSLIEKSVDVAVPVATAYDQWTQFESFPRFMEGVESVERLDGTRLHWKAEIAGVVREWDAEIVDQVPGRLISWRSLDGADNRGTVRFRPTAAGTEVTLRIDYHPAGFAEIAGDLLHIVDHRVGGDLERFKEFIESRGAATDGRRGEAGPGRTGPTPSG
jgi:uncharacterized membrane protein